MIRKGLMLAVALSASLASLPVLAQSGSYGGSMGGGSSSMSGGRSSTIGGTAARTSTYGGTGAAGGGATFNTLDHGHKGYLTRGDVKSDPLLARHFSQCDTNKNGKLSRSEFQACERKYGGK
ncbi:MAG: EF-hand domain-containing protein [Acidiferrobacteraceae bacterium]